jgi:protein phosphatase
LKNAGLGAIYTRSGRPYWDDPAQQKAVLEQMAQQLEDGNGWEFVQSDWLCLEAVISPLAAKAPAFGREVYGVVHAAGQHAVQQAQLKLEAAQGRGLQVHDALQRLKIIQQELGAFHKAAHAATGDAVAAWTWHPQQLLATEGKVWLGQSQVLQQAALHFLCDCWGTAWVKPTWMQADIDSETSLRSLTAWWEELNASGQKGIYIGPTQLLHEKKEEMMQPWIKVRCKEYLRLLFGPHYDAPASLQVLRERNLRLKRETSVRVYALAKEGLQRFVDKKEFDLVYQCVFTLLGIESRPADPRL